MLQLPKFEYQKDRELRQKTCTQNTAAVAMEQRAREMGKTAVYIVYRKYIEKMKKKTKEKNESLWANIHKKRQRIKQGSGERMRKKGEKGAPTQAQIDRAQNS